MTQHDLNLLLQLDEHIDNALEGKTSQIKDRELQKLLNDLVHLYGEEPADTKFRMEIRRKIAGQAGEQRDTEKPRGRDAGRKDLRSRVSSRGKWALAAAVLIVALGIIALPFRSPEPVSARGLLLDMRNTPAAEPGKVIYRYVRIFVPVSEKGPLPSAPPPGPGWTFRDMESWQEVGKEEDKLSLTYDLAAGFFGPTLTPWPGRVRLKDSGGQVLEEVVYDGEDVVIYRPELALATRYHIGEMPEEWINQRALMFKEMMPEEPDSSRPVPRSRIRGRVTNLLELRSADADTDRDGNAPQVHIRLHIDETSLDVLRYEEYATAADQGFRNWRRFAELLESKTLDKVQARFSFQLPPGTNIWSPEGNLAKGWEWRVAARQASLKSLEGLIQADFPIWAVEGRSLGLRLVAMRSRFYLRSEHVSYELLYKDARGNLLTIENASKLPDLAVLPPSPGPSYASPQYKPLVEEKRTVKVTGNDVQALLLAQADTAEHRNPRLLVRLGTTYVLLGLSGPREGNPDSPALDEERLFRAAVLLAPLDPDEELFERLKLELAENEK